jgi:hypothetical protein
MAEIRIKIDKINMDFISVWHYRLFPDAKTFNQIFDVLQIDDDEIILISNRMGINFSEKFEYWEINGNTPTSAQNGLNLLSKFLSFNSGGGASGGTVNLSRFENINETGTTEEFLRSLDANIEYLKNGQMLVTKIHCIDLPEAKTEVSVLALFVKDETDEDNPILDIELSTLTGDFVKKEYKTKLIDDIYTPWYSIDADTINERIQLKYTLEKQDWQAIESGIYKYVLPINILTEKSDVIIFPADRVSTVILNKIEADSFFEVKEGELILTAKYEPDDPININVNIRDF